MPKTRKRIKEPPTDSGVGILDQFVRYFNKRRGAGIEMIGTLPNGTIAVRYHDDRDDVPLDDAITWTLLFDKLRELHPLPQK